MIGSRFRRAHGLPAMACALALLAVPAAAGGLYEDQVHADSFGNLVIYSPAGYKRIIVGMGHTADAYNQAGSYYEPGYADPEIVYYEDEGRDLHLRRCNRQPVLLHGRSYMYGLPDNVVPQPTGICR